MISSKPQHSATPCRTV